MPGGVNLGAAFGSIGLDLSPLRAAAAGAQAAFRQIGQASTAAGRDIQSSMAGTTAAIDKLKGTINLQQRQYQILSAAVEKAAQDHGIESQQAQKASLALDRLSQSMLNNQTRLSGLNAKLEQQKQDLGQAESALNRFKEKWEVTSANLTKTGAILSAGITAPLAMLAKQATDIGGDYEQAMSVFQATTQASAAQMAQAADEAKALGADLQLPGASAADAGEVMLELAKAGLAVDESISEARGTMQLAAADNLSNAQAAEIAAAAYNNFRDQGVKVSEVADLLAASISTAGSGVMQSGQAIQQYGAAAAAAHIPIRDVVTQIDLMARAGIKGSDAGTSLKTMLQRLQGPTREASSEMAKLGINVYDAQGSMLPFREIVDQFSRATANLTQQERDQAIITIFGSDAQRAANLVLTKGVDVYDKMFAAVGRQGAAADMAAARMKGFKGAIEGFQSTVETALLEGIEPFLDGMSGVINGASGLIGAFMSIDPGVRNTIVVFGAAAAAAGPLMLAVGGLMAALAAVNLPLVGTAAALAALVAAISSGNPAVIGITAAVSAWAVAQQLKALPATLMSIPAIWAQTQAMIANAGATLAAAAPFAVLGAAIAGAILVYQKWQSVADDAAKKWLDQNPAYQGATAALKRYGEASEAARAKMAGQADELQRLQAAQEEDIKLRAQMAKDGKMESQAYAENTQRMNERTARIVALTDELNTATEADIKAAGATAQQTAAQQENTRAMAEAAAKQMAASGDIGGALARLREATHMADDEMKAYAKDLEKAATEGAKAFGQAIGSEVGFLKDREDAQADHGEKLKAIDADYGEKLKDLAEKREKAKTDAQRDELDKQIADLKQAHTDKLSEESRAFAASEQKAAEAYAREQAAQLAHLGQMLIDYTTAQAKMAGISDQKIAEMTSKLAAQYGVQQSIVDRSYGAMTGSIDAWVANGGTDTDQYLANMQRIQDSTVTMQQQVDQKISEMTAAAKADFDAGKISVDEYAERLTKIPAEAERAVSALAKMPTDIKVSVTATRTETVGDKKVTVDATSGRTAGGGTYSGTRASGGIVPAGTFAEVSEGGNPELLQVGGKTFLMMGGKPGNVVPATGMSPGMFGIGSDALKDRLSAGLAGAQSSGDALRDALAPRMAKSLQAAHTAMAGQRAAARVAGGLSGGVWGIGGSAGGGGFSQAPSGGHTINLTIAPQFSGTIVDNADRIKATASEIAHTVRQAVAGDLSVAVDRLITAGGAK